MLLVSLFPDVARLRVRDPGDALAGGLFVAFGLVTAGISSGYPLGTAMRMGAGYFPLLVGVLLVLLGGAILLRSLGLATARRNAPPAPFGLRPLLLVSAGVIAFALLVPALGLFLATLVLTAVSGFAHRRARLLEVLALGLALAAFGVLVFAWGLGLQLPVLPV